MKKAIAIIFIALFSYSTQAQVSYIGNNVDKLWLASFFDNSIYSVSDGYFDSQNEYLINGTATGNHNGNKTTIGTSRNGKCDGIRTTYSSPTSPTSIQANADAFMRYNKCSNIEKEFHDGKYSDGLFKLEYSGESWRGNRLVLITIQAHGSYNSYGTYFHDYYGSYICCAGI